MRANVIENFDYSEISENRRRRRTADTSRQALINFNKTKKRNRQTMELIASLKEHQPVSRTELERLTGIITSSLTARLNEAIGTSDPLIKICFRKPCRITGVTVNHYCLIDYNEAN